jgi:hypothetical protein
MRKSVGALLVWSSTLLAGVEPSAAQQVATKVCSGFTPQNWRDVLNVPATWQKEDCRAFMASTAASQFQLGCLFTQNTGPLAPKFAWGSGAPTGTSPTKADPPNPNCGW